VLTPRTSSVARIGWLACGQVRLVLAYSITSGVGAGSIEDEGGR